MTRKLIPALVMLLVSAVMLSTASFAWFANNTSVKANDMTVKVKSDSKFLQIFTATDGDGSTEADATNKTAPDDLDLVHAQIAEDNKTVSWFTGAAAAPNSSTVNDEGLQPLGTITDTYALINTFYVKMSTDTTLTNLQINSVTVTGAGELAPALRVLVVAKKEADDTLLGAQVWDVAGGALVTTAPINSAEFLAAQVNGTEFIELDVYVYYDGEDETATTNNAAAGVQEQTVSVSFKAQ